MKKILKRLATGFLAFATIVTALPTTAVHASEKQYWTESAERVGIIEKVMNDGSIGSTFNEGHMTVEGEDAFCVDINTNFKNGYKTRADASTRMSYDQISDVALSIEYVNQYVQSHSGLSSQHIYLLKQCVVWQRLSVHLGWQCDNVRASYDEIPTQITWFVITEFAVILLGDLPPLSLIEGAFLKYFGIPVALTWFMSQKTFDGKKPYSFLKSQITFALRPKVTYAGKAVKLEKEVFSEPVTAVRSVMYVPD